jgi:hypothetical protein
MSKEAMKQWAEDVSKAYDILAFGHTERAAEILGKTRDAIRKALAEQHLQDLHDENVLTNNGVLYFIDTVFYLTPDFWKTEVFLK